MRRKKQDIINEICEYLDIGSYTGSEIRKYRSDLKRVPTDSLVMFLAILRGFYR